MRWLESPDLSAVLIAFFAMLGTVMGGGTITQLLGRKKAAQDKPAEFAEVKGAIISDKAVERIVQSFDGVTAAATMLKTAIDRDVEAKQALTKALTASAAMAERAMEAGGGNLDVIRANTQAANAVATEAHDLRASIDDLSKELEFQSRMNGRRDG